MPRDFSPHGAYTSLEQLLNCRYLGKDINLDIKRQALSQQLGQYASQSRGRGIDFDEVRPYQAGDDIRSIDWRVTARTGNTHTKLFHQELERPVMVVCDQRLNMFFGSRCCFKSVLAAHIAATLSWAAWMQGDRLGGCIFAQQHHELKPKASRRQVLAFLKALNQSNQALNHNTLSCQNLQQHLKQLTRLAKPGSAIFIISDFHDLDEPGHKYLHQLKKHNDVYALYVYDTMEQQLPPPGFYNISDGQQITQLNTSSKKQREIYQKSFLTKQQHNAETMIKLGIPFLSLRTDESLREQLQSVFMRPQAHKHKANKVGQA